MGTRSAYGLCPLVLTHKDESGLQREAELCVWDSASWPVLGAVFVGRRFCRQAGVCIRYAALARSLVSHAGPRARRGGGLAGGTQRSGGPCIRGGARCPHTGPSSVEFLCMIESQHEQHGAAAPLIRRALECSVFTAAFWLCCSRIASSGTALPRTGDAMRSLARRPR